jgi:SnoaL-like protein
MPTPHVIAAFVTAVNAGDTEAFLALFDKRGVVNDWGTRYVGQQRIRAWSDRELTGAKATLEITSSEHHGNEVSACLQKSVERVSTDPVDSPSRRMALS